MNATKKMNDWTYTWQDGSWNIGNDRCYRTNIEGDNGLVNAVSLDFMTGNGISDRCYSICQETEKSVIIGDF